eukprot:1334972-Prymnesium_polylepis.1
MRPSRAAAPPHTHTRARARNCPLRRRRAGPQSDALAPPPYPHPPRGGGDRAMQRARYSSLRAAHGLTLQVGCEAATLAAVAAAEPSIAAVWL